MLADEVHTVDEDVHVRRRADWGLDGERRGEAFWSTAGFDQRAMVRVYLSCRLLRPWTASIYNAAIGFCSRSFRAIP